MLTLRIKQPADLKNKNGVTGNCNLGQACCNKKNYRQVQQTQKRGMLLYREKRRKLGVGALNESSLEERESSG